MRGGRTGRLTTILTLAAAGLGCSGACASAAGVPAVVEVRIEGRTSTLFEGPLRTDGHEVRAASDSAARPCDGTNGGRNPAPGATATAAAADAMTLISQSFDGTWNAGLDDYFITRFGTESEGGAESWSLFANDALANVGGCQLELREGAQLLWELGRPTAKPLLMLAPQGSTGGAPPLTALVHPGQPFGMEVLSYRPQSESEPPQQPSRAGASPFAGAEVAPVETAPDGAETVLAGDPSAVTTNSEGVATITFATPGWHRLKAIATSAVRSNRLDVCVAEAGSGCGAPPPEDDVRSVLPPAGAPGGSEPRTGEAPSHVSAQGAGQAPAGPASSVAAAHSARQLRLDGYALVPLDDRSPQLHLSGRWRPRREAGAWLGTVTIGEPGARLAVRLPRGRPAFVLRDGPRGARVLVIGPGFRRVVRIAPLPRDRSRLLLLPRTTGVGTVGLRIVSGSLGVDGVAVVG
jgi:hypothetical protein